MKHNTEELAGHIWHTVRKMYENQNPFNDPEPYVVYSLVKHEFIIINGNDRTYTRYDEWRWRSRNNYLLPSPDQVMVIPPYWTWSFVMEDTAEMGQIMIQSWLDNFLENLKKFKEELV